MTLLRPAGDRRQLDPSAIWGGDGPWGNTSASGERVNFATVIGLDAVAGCVGLMSDIVSTLPIHAYRDVAGVATKMSAQPQILASPSPNVKAIAWKAQAVVSWMLWGNVYGLVLTRDRLGYPTSIELLDPAQVSCVEAAPTGRPTWYVGGKEIDPERMVHMPGRYMRPGSILGLAPLERFRETYGLALAARRYGTEWFRDGAHPSAVIESDKAVNPDQATTIKSRFMAAARKRREPVVLGLGLKYRPMQGNPSDSQMIEVEGQVVGRVARVMGCPVEMIGGTAGTGGSITYQNREQRAVDLLTYHVDPHLVRLESLTTDCLPRPQYTKVARGALLRTDILTRYRAHDIAIRGGFATPNERRALEDEAPLPDGAGDDALWPPYATTVQPDQTAQGGQP